jgi:hypothetical protein
VPHGKTPSTFSPAEVHPKKDTLSSVKAARQQEELRNLAKFQEENAQAMVKRMQESQRDAQIEQNLAALRRKYADSST